MSRKKGQRRGERKQRTMSPDERYATWVAYLERSYSEIAEGFWYRKLYRAVGTMFATNRTFEVTEGAIHAWHWIRDMYGHYAIILIRREVDDQARAQTLQNLLDLEAHPEVLAARARGNRVPTPDEIRGDRETLTAGTQKVVDYANRFIAHRTPPGAPDVTFAEIDDALRAIRHTLRKYVGVIGGSDIRTTPEATFDWAAPFRIPWIGPAFKEPPLEEDRPLSDEERKRYSLDVGGRSFLTGR
jgi:hypothetical protein